ncbi:MAG: DUF308 domain-containing protein [Candidatus Hodarchaeota archaeon]
MISEILNGKNLKFVKIVFGLIICILSFLVLIFSVASVVILLIILSLTLLALGLAQILKVVASKDLERENVIFKYITGIGAIVISLIILVSIIVNPSGSIIIATTLFGIVIITIGFIIIYLGIKIKDEKTTYWIFLLIVGILIFIFGVLIIALPTFGFTILVILISLSLMLYGIVHLISGIQTK